MHSIKRWFESFHRAKEEERAAAAKKTGFFLNPMKKKLAEADMREGG